MIVLIGGSGSTGSSLLKNILNRHPQIFAGEESNLFCKAKLYTDFQSYKSSIIKRGLFGLKNHGWHIYNGVDLYSPEYNLTKESLHILIAQSNSFMALTSQLQDHFLKEKDQQIWIEKTPANSANFGLFLNKFVDGKIIHITRNPLDTIGSLISRGYTLFYAVGIYLLNTASALQHKDNVRCYTIKYEDLVDFPEKSIHEICKFLDIEFDPMILHSQKENIAVSQLKGWQYDETANIGKKSVGRFEKLNPKLQSEIIYAIHTIKISSKGKSIYNIEYNTIMDLAESLGYPIPNIRSRHKTKLQSQRRVDRWRRIIKAYPTGIRYPLKLQVI